MPLMSTRHAADDIRAARAPATASHQGFITVEARWRSIVMGHAGRHDDKTCALQKSDASGMSLILVIKFGEPHIFHVGQKDKTKNGAPDT